MIQKTLLSFSLILASLTIPKSIALGFPLNRVEINTQNNVAIDEQLWGDLNKKGDLSDSSWVENPSKPIFQGDRAALVTAINNSLSYLTTPKATKAYRRYAGTNFNLIDVRRSLIRFRELLLTTSSATELQEKVISEFAFYQSPGQDNQGAVHFTGYFEPTYVASRVRTEEFPYPLYRKPEGFDHWKKPHPTRFELEGKDGLSGNPQLLAGNEIVWLSDRLEAFLVQVQGSARLQLTDGTTMSITYGGSTNYRYTSIGKELVKDGVFTKEELTLPKLMAYFEANPQALDQYIPRNNRFIFFYETNGNPPNGSLGVPVTGDRSIATDKSIMPPGALAFIEAPIPQVLPNGEIQNLTVSRYVLDQDTGSAIKGAGRVDIFLGSGKVAGERAGLINGMGKLYYLLLKEKK
ncbi:MAG: MltA domain-containing protein [Xenococcaceae cyanobacterium MO_167.B52]|nr:MltA domain-containing protein [Xenococcaceae cyanobacterium MO_167.B52]